MSDTPQVRRLAKNTVFLDLFSIPEYQLQMVQTLHPEMTDLTEQEITTLTLNPVILNGQYNDLALLVRDKLIIFVEAQSTWSINILIRLLMYLAATYYEYISDRGLNVYTSTKLEIPEPEFYVIYTGSHKVDREIISLRKDFWNNPNAKIDLTARVIHTESKHDVIGQYIIFCHVLDEQIKIHGYDKKAAEEAIRICQNAEVLKQYLEGRKKEVIGIMRMLFDQDYANRVHERELLVGNTVEMCQDFGASIDDTIHRLAEKFGFSKDVASRFVHEYWRS